MRKLLFIICIALLSFACEGPEGAPGPEGPGMNWDVQTFQVFANDWELVGRPDELNSYYVYVFKWDALSNFIYAEGSAQGYIQLMDNNVEVQTPLPYVSHYADNDGHRWTETLSYDFSPGSVAFYVRYDDFATGLRPPTCKFRMVLNW